MTATSARETRFAIAAFLLGLLVSLLLAEGVLRLAGIEYTTYPTRFQFGWPDSKTLDTDFVLDPVIQWKPKEYDAMLAAAQGQPVDIVHLGDSCTQLGAYRGELLNLVQQRHPGLPFHSLKLAVAGWSSYQGVRQMERDVAPLRPRVATIYFGWNDHWLSYGLEDKAMDFSPARFALYRQLQRSRVFQVGAWAYNSLLLASPTGQRPLRVSPADFHANLTRMVQLSRANGIVPILMTAPTSHRTGEEPAYLQDRFLDDLSQLVPLHQQYAGIVRQVAQEQDVLLLDLAAEFAALPYSTVKDEYLMYDGIHLRPAGSRAVAERLYQFLAQHRLLPGQATE